MTLDGENVTTFSLKQELSFVAKKIGISVAGNSDGLD